MARQPTGSPVWAALSAQLQYDGIETCAVDGSCSRACPVGIDTGALVKQLRTQRHSLRSEQLATRAARHYAIVERAARVALRSGGAAARAFGDDAVGAVPAALRHAFGDEAVPSWTASIPAAAPSRLPFTVREGAVAAYMPACINRIFGNAHERRTGPTVPDALVALSARAGMPVWIPDDVVGHCCGVPWSSKGFAAGHDLMVNQLSTVFVRWTEGGRLPVVIDATSCAHGLIAEVAPDGVEVLDSIAWVYDFLLERLEIPAKRRLRRVAVHPTCAADHLGLSGKLVAIARRLADEVVVPAASGCCGMAGDRGLRHPELPASALRELAREIDGERFDACLSSNRTCEIALREVTGHGYASFMLALEEATRVGTGVR